VAAYSTDQSSTQTNLLNGVLFSRWSDGILDVCVVIIHSFSGVGLVMLDMAMNPKSDRLFRNLARIL
jgi:hypothetical protein